MSTRIVRPRATLRKEPRQARSRATVEAVIEAGARILSAEGWAGFTTNRVAEAAGVSIGSFYQYFPDKVSLVGAIRRRHLDDSLAAVKQARAGDMPLEDFVAGLVDNLIAAHSLHPGLQRVLLDEAPGMDEFWEQNARVEADYMACFTDIAAAYRGRRGGADDETMGAIISDTIDGVIHNAARRGRLEDPKIRGELVRIIRLYLAEGAARVRTA